MNVKYYTLLRECSEFIQRRGGTLQFLGGSITFPKDNFGGGGGDKENYLKFMETEKGGPPKNFQNAKVLYEQ